MFTFATHPYLGVHSHVCRWVHLFSFFLSACAHYCNLHMPSCALPFLSMVSSFYLFLPVPTPPRLPILPNINMTGGICTHSRHFIDVYSCMCNLHKVNLLGNCKTCIPLWTLSCYVNHSPINDNHAMFTTGVETVTFIRRPFPLDEAPQHLA